MDPAAALDARRSVQEVVAQPLSGFDVPSRDRPARVARALTLLGLDGLEGRKLGQLGPLPRLRVALARALAPEQPVLLLDDPLAGLDPPARRALGFELRGLVRRLGLTVLLATRDGEEAMALGDRVAVLEDGRIAQLDTPRRLYEEPATAFVASLAGENNRLPGTVDWREEEECGVRLDCGPLVEARVADAGGPGSRCIVAVRPERVAVAAIPAEDMGRGRCPRRCATRCSSAIMCGCCWNWAAAGCWWRSAARQPHAGARRPGLGRLGSLRGLRLSGVAVTAAGVDPLFGGPEAL